MRVDDLIRLGCSNLDDQDYDKAIEIDLKYEEAYYIRGISQYENGDYVNAIMDFAKAIELNPNRKNELESKIEEAQKKIKSTYRGCK